jgi:hypothetical protein
MAETDGGTGIAGTTVVLNARRRGFVFGAANDIVTEATPTLYTDG